MKSITSSTGGKIVRVPGGLVHYTNTERLVDVNAITVRPTKVSVEEGLQFDFSAFITPVKLTGPQGRVIKAK